MTERRDPEIVVREIKRKTRRAEARGVADRIVTRCADMNALDLDGETVDLVWAEGSAYNTGIPEALKMWRSFLKPGGAVGFTELTWIEDGAPDECREFFAAEYPPMTDVATNLATIEACGYGLVGRFTVPESSWRINYHESLSRRLAAYDPAGDEGKQTIFDMCRTEIEIYRRFSRWYGYEFFMLRKRDLRT